VLGTLEPKPILRKNVRSTRCGVVAMMTVDEWRKRAHACMAASRQTSDPDAQMQWQSLAEAWLHLCEIWPGPAEQRERGKFRDNETPVTVVGEKLRARLTLPNENKANLRTVRNDAFSFPRLAS
jgi:hypothetical protein